MRHQAQEEAPDEAVHPQAEAADLPDHALRMTWTSCPAEHSPCLGLGPAQIGPAEEGRPRRGEGAGRHSALLRGVVAHPAQDQDVTGGHQGVEVRRSRRIRPRGEAAGHRSPDNRSW